MARLWLEDGTEGASTGGGVGAHKDAAEKVSGLGDVSETADRWQRWSEPEVEDDGDGNVVGRPRMHGSSGMMETMRRSRWTRRLVEGRAVAAVVGDGGDGRVRADTRERDRGGMALEGERGRGAGVAWPSPWRWERASGA